MDALRDSMRHAQQLLSRDLSKLGETIPKDETASVRLWELARGAIFASTVGPLLSTYIANEENAKIYEVFEKAVPLLFAGVPPFLLKDAIKARDILIKESGTPEYLEQASPLIKARKAELTHTADALDRGHVGMIFASAGNTTAMAFWLLYELLRDPKAFDAIEKEVMSTVGNDAFFSMEQLDKMVNLQSAFMETARMYHAGFKPSMVKKDMVVDCGKKGKFLLKGGTRIMSFDQIVHYDADIFEDPETFRWDRFLPDPVTGEPPVFSYPKSGKRLGDLLSFGRGLHNCPGRRFVAYEMKFFVAMMMQRFEMKLAENNPKPGANKTMEGIGMRHPAKDVVMEVRWKLQKDINKNECPHH
eukprot:CAMPEP_0116847940 /NCGR_PEP_ID=MMETSP0418-20121206/14709_1 /TAXON_ID=1158023 /ORGANISM="Astrosyne radiata, Strain 13vi08-1A" /LENGTH=358 /DNA_ID=CAMNT_0004479433 /DNA_START=45 /DNA_END=1121 /DNA_ORIENTATION=+